MPETPEALLATDESTLAEIDAAREVFGMSPEAALGGGDIGDISAQELRTLMPEPETKYPDPFNPNQYSERGAQEITIYSMRDGRPATILGYMLMDRLSVQTYNPRLDRITKAFTLRKSEAPVYKEGKLPCLFHMKNPRRAEVEASGVDVYFSCNKANFTSDFQIMEHCEIRHPSSLKRFKEYLVERDKEERRAFEQEQIAWMRKMTAPGAAAEDEEEYPCVLEGCGKTFGSKRGLAAHIRFKHVAQEAAAAVE